jgi:hypothetical protein
MLEDIWDKIVDEFDYFIHFQWFGDIGEFFSGLFENLTEISFAGIIGGIIGVVLTNMTVDKLDAVNSMNGVSRMFFTGVLYLFSFVLTYIMVKRVFDN